MTILKPVVLSIFLLASCNRQRTFTVTLAHGYTGPVSLSCTSLVDTDTQALVGGEGASSVACPARTANLRVLRDGQEVSPSEIKWMTTGDGIVSGLRFTVR